MDKTITYVDRMDNTNATSVACSVAVKSVGVKSVAVKSVLLSS